jgi:hypothetical protein
MCPRKTFLSCALHLLLAFSGSFAEDQDESLSLIGGFRFGRECDLSFNHPEIFNAVAQSAQSNGD